MRAGVAPALVAALILASCGGAEPASQSPGAERPEPTGATPSSTLPGGTGDPKDPKAGSAPDPCELLSTEEIEAAVRSPVAEGVGAAGADCHWTGEPGQPRVSLALVPFRQTSACTATRPDGAQEVSGVGAEAWWDFLLAETAVGSVVACPRGYQVTVTLSGGTNEASLRAAAEELAAAALGRL